MKRAFTLMELLIVVIIIGILASLAIPMFKGAVYKARMAEIFPAVHIIEQSFEQYIAEYPWPETGEWVWPGFLVDYDLPGESEYFYYTLFSTIGPPHSFGILVFTKDPDARLCYRAIVSDGTREWYKTPSRTDDWAKYLRLP